MSASGRAFAEDSPPRSGEVRLQVPGTVLRLSHGGGGARGDYLGEHELYSPHTTFGLGIRVFSPNEHGVIAEGAWLHDWDSDGLLSDYGGAYSLFVAHVGYAHRHVAPFGEGRAFVLTEHVTGLVGRETFVGRRGWREEPDSEPRRQLRGRVFFGARVGLDFDFHREGYFFGFGVSYGFAYHMGGTADLGVSHLVGFNLIPRIGGTFGGPTKRATGVSR